MIGSLVTSFISLISLTPCALMAAAPPCLAAIAILPLIKELCKGSSDKAWQETIKFPFTTSNILSPFF